MTSSTKCQDHAPRMRVTRRQATRSHMLDMCCLRCKVGIHCPFAAKEYMARLTAVWHSLLHSSCWSDCNEQLWRSRFEVSMQGLEKVMEGLSISCFTLGARDSSFRLLPSLRLSGRQYLLSHYLLYAILSLKSLCVNSASVSIQAARSPLCHFHLPTPFRSSPSVLRQKWSGLDSNCSAVEALHAEDPLGLLRKFLTPIIVAAVAIAFLQLILYNPDNSWTLAAQTLTQFLRQHFVQPFFPSIARWTDPVSMPMFRYFFWRKHKPTARSSAAKGRNRAKGHNLSRPSLERKQNRPPTFPSLGRHPRPSRTTSNLTPSLLRRKLENLGGARSSKRSRRSRWYSAQHYPLQQHSGFASAFGSSYQVLMLVCVMFFEAPTWENVVGILLPLRGLSSSIWLLFFEEQGTPAWDVLVSYGTSAKVALLISHSPECQNLASRDETL